LARRQMSTSHASSTIRSMLEPDDVTAIRGSKPHLLLVGDV
jgi:hypothetical protein